MAISQERAEFATAIFIRECIRQYIKMHPGSAHDGSIPVKALAEYPVQQQRALTEAIKAAVEASTGMTDLFERFKSVRAE